MSSATIISKALGDESKVEENLDDFFDDEDDFIPSSYREERYQQMQAEMNKYKYLNSKDHGQYVDVETPEEFLKITTKQPLVVCHFYHPSMKRCGIVDKHLKILCRQFYETKFIKFDITKSEFLANRLKVQVLPAILIFIDGINKDRIVGFGDLGNKDDFETSTLVSVLANKGVLGDLGAKSVVKETMKGPSKKQSTVIDDFDD